MVSKIVTKFHELNARYWKYCAAVTIVIVLFLGWGMWFIFTHESTDDAFIEGDVSIISPKVAGHIDRVYVRDNQPVQAGQALCEIDSRDYKNALSLSQAQWEAAKAEARQAGEDLARYQKLLSTKDISQQQYDKALLRWNTDQAEMSAAQARLDQAKLNLSYTKILSPANGVVTKKSIEPGMFVEPGQALLAVVFPERWVIANLKETQMTHIRAGLKATIRVDAYPGLVFHGHVDSIQQGTGARFSLLPAENATGNYIKVVQRVPVKIVIDDSLEAKRPLELGMSVVPTIDLSSGKAR